MAKFTKKLHIKNSSGVEQTCGIYGTTSEVGSAYIYAIVDGTQGYIPLVSTSSNKATSGRVLKSGTTYAIGKAGQVTYDYKVLTIRATPVDYSGSNSKLVVASSGTFQVPADVYSLRVTCVGGGAGGWNKSLWSSTPHGYSMPLSSAWTWNSSSKTTWCSLTAGGKTTFGSVSAAGATYSVVTCGTTTCGGGYSRDSYYSGYTCYYPSSIKVSQGTTNGTASTYTSHGGYGGEKVSVTNVNGTVICSAGAGGDSDALAGSHCSGASGKKVTQVISVNPGDKISYSIGAFGKGWDNGTTVSSEGGYRHVNDSDTGAGAGYNGIILVEWGGSI